MKENMLDKCIKANLKMVENEIAIACTMGVLLCVMNFWAILLGLIPVAIAIFFLFRMCRKLFYTSVFGETAATYQSLPASAGEMAAGKIFVSGLGFIALNLSMIIMLYIIGVNMGGSDVLILVFALGLGTDLMNSAYMLPLEFIVMVIECFWESALIFMAVIYYNTLPEPERKGFKGGALVPLGAVGINFLLTNVSKLLDLAGLSYSIWYPLLNLVVGICTLVVLYRLVLKLLEGRYELR